MNQEVYELFKLDHAVLIPVELQHQVLEVVDLASYLHLGQHLVELFGTDGPVLVDVELVEDRSEDVFITLLVTH